MANLKQIRVRKSGIMHGWGISHLNKEKTSSFKEYIESLNDLFNSLNFLYSSSILYETMNNVKLTIYLTDWRIESYLLSRYNVGLIDYSLILRYLNFRRKFSLDMVYQDRVGRLCIVDSYLFNAGMRYYNKPLLVEYFILDDKSINSGLISGYIKEKLKQGLFLKSILNRLSKNLLKLCNNKKIGGFYIMCKGRYSKAPRASKVYILGGLLGFSSLDNNIEYSEVGIILKYGTVSINVWILKSNMKNYREKIKI